ncbi:MAG: GAG-pre-integrase domain-containing protein, partial [Sweet potato little leaf phytoplasma]|nr:GAG-pre-integrase domain-containing protein [Sweet potato little leaf phytoplasma]
KGSMKMIEYLAVMKQASENLQLAGNPISLGDLISYALAGLDSDYIPIVCTINDKDIKTWQELSSILVTFEGTLARYSTVPAMNNELPDLAAHLALNRQSRFDQRQFSNANNYGNRGNGNNGNNQQNYQQNYSRNNYGGNRGGRGRGRNGFQRNNSKPTCQLCGKFGHSAPACYMRFEESFNNPHASGNMNSQGGNSSGSSAYIAAPEIVNDPKWLADSGATNHVTADAGNLAVKMDYTGKESLIVGNGTKLKISHTGSTVVPSSLNDASLVLKNILHVPDIKKNLISIASLTADNNVYVEFHSNYFLVKDKISRRVMLHGTLKRGLYQLDLPSIQTSKSNSQSSLSAVVSSPSNKSFVSAFQVQKSVSCNVPLNLWHSRLGHASAKVVKSVLKSCNVVLNVNEKFSFCESCQKGKSHKLPFPQSFTHIWQPLELIHCDLWGPAPVVCLVMVTNITLASLMTLLG